ncbi:MAG: NgoFVII family restriction endonuclease, partial [Sarcina sp.]
MKEGLYEQVINEEILNELKNLNNDDFIIDKLKMDKEEAKVILTTYISSVIRRGLDYVRDKSKDEKDKKLLKQIELCNRIIHTISEYSQENDINGFKIDESGEMLMALYSKINNSLALKKSHKDIVRPVTPLSQSSLFTGATMEPDMLSELKKEILTSDSIDFLVSFIKWSGIRCILDELKEFTAKKNKRLRVITTSYMGATDIKAIEELAKLPNTEIKISYDTKRTRLHAKAYMFYRETEFTTAYIGSS